jgi:hypothetical protein
MEEDQLEVIANEIEESLGVIADSVKFTLNVLRSIKPIFVWFSPCIGFPFKS